MTTWKTGRRILAERLTERAIPLKDFLDRVIPTSPLRVPGTAVFMTAQPHGTPPALAHNLRHNKVLHEHVVVLLVATEPVPTCHPTSDEVRSLGRGCSTCSCDTGSWRIRTSRALAPGRNGLEMDVDDVTYFLGRETIS